MGKVLCKKTVWVPGPAIKFKVGSDFDVAMYIADDWCDAWCWTRKPSKAEATDGGWYPEHWPPKRVRITIEEV